MKSVQAKRLDKLLSKDGRQFFKIRVMAVEKKHVE